MKLSRFSFGFSLSLNVGDLVMLGLLIFKLKLCKSLIISNQSFVWDASRVFFVRCYGFRFISLSIGQDR